MTKQLTIENVLSRIDQKEVMERFFGDSVIIGRRYTNPFRNDNHPNCWFSYVNNTLMFNDYGSPYFGDAVAICSYRLGTSLYPALKFLNNEYQLGLGYDHTDQIIVPEPRQLIEKVNTIKPKSTIIYQRYEDFGLYDYFFEYGVQKETLNLFNVYPCEKVWVKGIKKTEIFRWAHNEPLYIYDFFEKGKKMYRPLSDTFGKWRCNTTCIQGEQQLKNKDELIIRTSSLKDVMVLYECGLQADAPQSENQTCDRRKNMVILYDNDKAGAFYAQKNALMYNCAYLKLPDLRKNEKILKDISDISKAFGITYAKDLIYELLWEKQLLPIP